MKRIVIIVLFTILLAGPVHAATPELYVLVESALAGDAEAQYRLSRMYANGRPGGLSQNFLEATYWADQAAQQGHPDAQYLRGLLYRVIPDGASSQEGFLRCMSRAADQGHPLARKLLATVTH